MVLASLSVNCTAKDEPQCGNVFNEKTCTYSNVPAMCPWMCKICPCKYKSFMTILTFCWTLCECSWCYAKKYCYNKFPLSDDTIRISKIKNPRCSVS